jgi:hypothetical protein
VTEREGKAYWRARLLPPLAWAVLAAAGYWPTSSLAGDTGIREMLMAQGLVVAIVYLTLIPSMKTMVNKDVRARFRVMLLVGVVRFVITVPAAALVAYTYSSDTAAFLVWIAITYVVMIKIETLALLYWNRQLETSQ